jgi:hypothetical protein
VAKQQLLIHLSEKEQAAALVRVGRAVRETFAGLDIITPTFAVIVSQHGVPVIASNMQDTQEVIEYARMIADCMTRGVKVTPVLVPERKSMQAAFLSIMRRSRGTEPMDEESLSGLLRTYVTGYLEAVTQYAGFKAVKDIANDYPWLSDPNWLPGPEWYYWLDREEMT